MVDTTQLRHMANRLSYHSLFSFSKLSDDTADELDALRKASAEKDKRISQLERLVCADIKVGQTHDKWYAYIPFGKPLSPFLDTQQAAIDAAIRHMEANEATT